MVDAAFADPWLAEIYDPLDPDRADLDAYVALVDEFGASRIVDIGCGTGTLACRLAKREKQVTALDPAAASLAVARRKPGADRVQWVLGDVRNLPVLRADMATMTGNTAQVFLGDEEWGATLRAARTAVQPGGLLVFETRDPSRDAWRSWTREETFRRVDLPGAGVVQTWNQLIDVRLPFVSFRRTFIFATDGNTLVSDSTLRFRDRDEIAASLRASGFVVEELRGAPDRPGLELVFIARHEENHDRPVAGHHGRRAE